METIKALLNIQSKLKAPKGQKNDFGKYRYRSAEDILAAVKPLLFENSVVLTLRDELVLIGDRYYIKATATLVGEGSPVETTAYAREEEMKKGMDGSQITGTASSYARKYALNGLFAIDDTKDADTNEFYEKTHSSQDDGREKVLRDTILGMVNGDMTGINRWIERMVKAGRLSETTTFDDLDINSLAVLKVTIARSMQDAAR